MKLHRSIADRVEPVGETKPLSYSYWLGTFVLRGSVLPRILPDVVGFGLLAAAMVFISQFVAKHYEVSLAMPARPFEVAGTVLGLLLVLRLNAGYDRWWEARKLWGGIVNESRNLAIAGLAYGTEDQQWRAQFIKWVAAFPHVTRRSLRGERCVPELARLLTSQQIDWLKSNEHMPDAVSRRIASLLHDARRNGMNGFAFQEAERQRSLLIDYLGGCERILKTPLARSGAIQVRQFIFLLLAFLPLSLMQDFEGTLFAAFWGASASHRVWLVPLFIMILAYMLLALDRIGMELQNPFDTRRVDFLPLDGICTTIEKNLLELLHDDNLHDYSAPMVSEVELPPDASAHISDEDLPADIS
ncbi:bestrophin family protein [Aureliella helgolandensis]|uniref:Bestrophin, RFP-TM, chloride channel n=1 Tax=Aureliella helgolandensis TaxID=2527968 RepID=A0A518GD82_9BACT|nr:bestrophin family ion channel [Aureliella helgolandensis]QDV26527.1 Bestrophin, RFP-TM, chloride channel [Aureliella helgolandensis]